MEQFMNMVVVALLSMSAAVQSKAPAPPVPKIAAVRIENWPVLKVTEHMVSSLPAGCSTDGTGCAAVNFEERTCDIYVLWRERDKVAARERETRRCRGYDQPPYRLQTAYTQWLSTPPCRCGKEGEGQATVAFASD